MGIQDVQPLWHTGAHAIRTPYGTVLPPGGRVAAYLRSTGLANYDPPEVAENLHTTLAAALKTCRSGAFDTIVVLPGHLESVVDATMLNNMVNGTRIIGLGDPRQAGAPIFRWTDAAAQWNVTKNDVLFHGLRLNMANAPAAITKGISIVGNGCEFSGCRFLTSLSATGKSEIVMEIGTSAHSTRILGNWFQGTSPHNSTDIIKIVGANPAGDVFVDGNSMICPATAANGLIHVTVACKGLSIRRNYLVNTMTSSTSCITLDNVAIEGMVADNRMRVMADGTASAQGIIVGGASVLCGFFENYCSDEAGKSGVLSPPVVAT